MLPLHNGCNDYDSCIVVTVEMAVTVMDGKVVTGVMNVTNETEETNEMAVTDVTVERAVAVVMGVRCDS